MGRRIGTGEYVTEPAADLAAQLRALKDRSGLSFGALAQKLHVGTSTLHRYCAGEAVPVEFAVVDRFGRLCGATGDEMVALHRAWLVADAVRTRGVEPPGPGLAPEVDAREVAARPADEPARPMNRRRAVVITAIVLSLCVLAGGLTAWLADGEGDDTAAVQNGAPAADPLTTTLRTNLWEAGCDHSYLIDKAPTEVPEPPVEADAADWSAELAGVDARRTIVEVTVAGTGDEPVVLQGLTVRVVHRRAPLSWNVYAMNLGCGGALSPATYAVDLDQPRPIARARGGHDGENPLPAVTFPFRVSRTDPVVLLVVAQTLNCDCDWFLELAWTAGGRTGTKTIGNGERPFRTSGSTKEPYGYLESWGR